MKRFMLCCMLAGMVLVFGGCDEKEQAETVAVKAEPVAKKTKQAGPEFFEHALNGNTLALKAELQAGVDVNSQNPDQRTALMFAGFNGHTETAELLISNGANINMTDNVGRGALMFASTGPFNETVKLLLEKGADVNAIEKQENWTALMFAAAEGQSAVVMTLLENGADWKLKDIDGDTARNFAANNGHMQVAEQIDSFIKTKTAE